jgi:hypothetical protein
VSNDEPNGGATERVRCNGVPTTRSLESFAGDVRMSVRPKNGHKEF